MPPKFPSHPLSVSTRRNVLEMLLETDNLCDLLWRVKRNSESLHFFSGRIFTQNEDDSHSQHSTTLFFLIVCYFSGWKVYYFFKGSTHLFFFFCYATKSEWGFPWEDFVFLGRDEPHQICVISIATTVLFSFICFRISQLWDWFSSLVSFALYFFFC